MATRYYDDVSRKLNVLECGVLQGALGNNTARGTNRTNFNAAIARAASENKVLDVPPGTYEIAGGALINTSDGFKWEGTTKSLILQYTLNVPVLHLGAPLGTASAVCEGNVIDGALLKYAGVGTAGANALELTGVWMSSFKNIHIGDPNASFAGRTSVPYVGIALDGTAGTVPPFSNTWENIRIKHWGWRGISSPRPSYDGASTGSKWLNIYISGGDGGGQQDTSAVAGNAGAYFQMHKQLSLENFNVEWCQVSVPLVLDNCGETEAQAVNFEGISLKLASSGEAGFVECIIGRIRATGITVYDNRILSANNITHASLFRLYDASTVEVGNITIESTTKTSAPATPPFSFVRHMSPGGNNEVGCALVGEVRLNGSNLNAFDTFAWSGTPGALFTQLTGWQSSTPQTLTDANATHYTYLNPGVLLMAPSTARTVTLSNLRNSGSTATIPRGVKRVVRKTGGAGNLLVANYEGSTIATLTTTSSTTLVFDGTNWVVAA